MLKRIIILVCLLSIGVAKAFDTKAKQAILVDYATGTVLFEKNPNQKIIKFSKSFPFEIYDSSKIPPLIKIIAIYITKKNRFWLI